MYQRTFAAVVGFHACEQAVGEKLVNLAEAFHLSNRKWDWLGPGVYFWENNHERALQWAKDESANDLVGIAKPAVVGAFIDLGLCLDLTQHECLQQMALAYSNLKAAYQATGKPLPANRGKVRNLDCAVISELHRLRRVNKLPPYETVRAPFGEFDPLYEGTEFTKGGHIQIAVLNRNCIKAVFWPRKALPWPPLGRPPKPKTTRLKKT